MSFGSLCKLVKWKNFHYEEHNWPETKTRRWATYWTTEKWNSLSIEGVNEILRKIDLKSFQYTTCSYISRPKVSKNTNSFWWHDLNSLNYIIYVHAVYWTIFHKIVLYEILFQSWEFRVSKGPKGFSIFSHLVIGS